MLESIQRARLAAGPRALGCEDQATSQAGALFLTPAYAPPHAPIPIEGRKWAQDTPNTDRAPDTPGPRPSHSYAKPDGLAGLVAHRVAHTGTHHR